MRIEGFIFRRLLLIGVTAYTLAGCTPNEDAKASGQVAANVNESEVTYLQLNYLLRSNGIDSTNPNLVKKSLEALIDQELLFQQGVNAQLDRDPEIMQSIEMAKRQILVEAYSRRFIYPQSEISDTEAQAYFDANPDLFSRRRQYDLHIFSIAADPDKAALLEKLDENVTAASLRRLLSQNHVDFVERETRLSSQQLPLSMVSDFAKAKVGDLLVATSDGNSELSLILAVEDTPVSFADVRLDINNFLRGLREREAIRTRIDQLRKGSQIVYSGQFSESAPQPAVVSEPTEIREQSPAVTQTQTH